MKQIIAILAVMAITTAAMAAPHAGIGIIKPAPRPVVIVQPHYYGGFGYRPYYSPFRGYNSFYSPYYGYGYGYNQRPSKLDLNVEQINNDYQDQISDVRHNKSLSGSERRSQIRDLRHERSNSIIQAKRDYYHPQSHTGAATVVPDENDVNAAH